MSNVHWASQRGIHITDCCERFILPEKKFRINNRFQIKRNLIPPLGCFILQARFSVRWKENLFMFYFLYGKRFKQFLQFIIFMKLYCHCRVKFIAGLFCLYRLFNNLPN